MKTERKKRTKGRWLSALVLACGLWLTTEAGIAAQTGARRAVDYAESTQCETWLRHPVLGDASFDAFVHDTGALIQRGAPPYEWPVNGFLFDDPVSGRRYGFVGEYGRGYLRPASHCRLHRSTDGGKSWADLGVVLQGAPSSFDRGGHTPDVSVVYDGGRYHMVYDWGELDFNVEGGLAYAWAERPEGPWQRAPEPITRNSKLTPLLSCYQRTYAATLLRRRADWLILGMMDHPPTGWALFAMTSPRPEGPWSERRLLLYPERDTFHPPLMEFFPAFVHLGSVYAPATSVALNRDFNALFQAKLERADDPVAWHLDRLGSVWHSEDREAEFDGIWGQTFSGQVDRHGVLHAMFPSRDPQGRGTIQLASRPWGRPLRERGFVLSGHQGPAFTWLRRAYGACELDATFRRGGMVELLLDYAAPLEPSAPASDATAHAWMQTRHTALRLAKESWAWLRRNEQGGETIMGTGPLPTGTSLRLRLARDDREVRLRWGNEPAQTLTAGWTGGADSGGVLGWRVEARSRVEVERFVVRGVAWPARFWLGPREALLGAGESAGNWDWQPGAGFRWGEGAVARRPGARVKWNFQGNAVSWWSPCGPEFGTVEVRLDGETVGTVDLRADHPMPSAPRWSRRGLRGDCHALVLVSTGGKLPVDSIEAWSGSAQR
jgi:hypothetical protein